MRPAGLGNRPMPSEVILKLKRGSAENRQRQEGFGAFRVAAIATAVALSLNACSPGPNYYAYRYPPVGAPTGAYSSEQQNNGGTAGQTDNNAGGYNQQAQDQYQQQYQQQMPPAGAQQAQPSYTVPYNSYGSGAPAPYAYGGNGYYPPYPYYGGYGGYGYGGMGRFGGGFGGGFRGGFGGMHGGFGGGRGR